MKPSQLNSINQTMPAELKKEELRNAYLMANEDQGQLEATKDWSVTLTDGLKDCKKNFHLGKSGQSD